jgi:predicted transcriptional regulator of viral defense system
MEIKKILATKFAKSTTIRYFSQNIPLMPEQDEIKLRTWVQKLQSQGKYAFSLELLEQELPNYTAVGIKRALSRLSKKRQILSIHKGYYLIIPLPYSSRGVLPPALYLDNFMEYLKRPYYLGLLNAAAFHGATHQQPQEYFVVTTFPVLRPTLKKGLKVNYISKKQIPSSLVEVRKTESGYLNISNPILTATDLIHFEKRVGGMNRVATVLNELMDVIQPKDFVAELIQYIPITAFQRLGYLMENVLENQLLADALYDFLKENAANFFRIPLKASAPVKGCRSEERWKVIVNTEIEIDE